MRLFKSLQYETLWETARLETRKNFYGVKITNELNEIPDWVKEKESVNASKNAYDEWASHQNRPREGGEFEEEIGM